MAKGEQHLFGRRFTIISAVIVVLGLIYLVLRSDPELRPRLYPPEPVVSGLTNPRALAIGADGLLYVAEAGGGGQTSGQVSRITAEGQPEAVATGLPSNAERGRLRPAGPSSVWPLDGAFLVVTGSADDALLRVRRQQPSVPATDLRSALAKVGLTGTLAPLGLVVDGTQVVILEAASATLVRLDLREPDNPQPTVVGRLPAGVNALNLAPSAEGGWLVVDFGAIPYEQGSGAVWHVNPTGQVERVVEGLTMPVDVTTGAAGELYVVELSAFYNRRTDRFTPGTGRVVLARSGEGARPMLADLDFPTAIVRGADNNLYFTTHGAFGEPGSGGIWRIPARTGFTTVTP